MWKKKEIFTIPNALSLFRIVLAILFLELGLKWGMDERQPILIGILLVSAMTDFLDGKIARKFNMVSELGKILDPIADKITQGALLICFLYKYRTARYVFLFFLIKESYMAIMGLKAVTAAGKNEGAMWYGKVNTAFFYAVMVILVLFQGIPQIVAEILISGSGLLMLLALVLYVRYFNSLQKIATDKKTVKEEV